ncbi:MAG: oxaloacetate decarboxylase subunit alpha [gamma proteobacterium symbiont of Ctena orbiculata]|uniref:Sodium-extruding oxaloacetate decarboxylase subunit alpha n=1 Tax=Candidatus Thiodiazotropha taylori TaxID=2792791 RepID=A0A944MB67_9GAMM|nr:sodium-extruding oxaloacetate decarboxylase subunit alpha [Candidatus Thiodiazotropha taylori]PUB88633.1 MAG: oxaloacetate decarboxylase subunit alpha [gamma proteobacterium symbiont of Ctena orbiculata]MBT3027342.1 sodium-extruding oxaloacetate decarboxylase subunit alpha [Candidatus Thiodiazotropha taylori]MBT3035195.1 sodium-extruding oxaloacetate decarboxylase subunit alpha [Candidatus Thiodiazotropha taylori]MBV2138469.1 sodium-extruding oxaloacetate decarboxylase subunit alpha [Candida
MSEKKPLGITDVVLRDAHQSLFATRMRIEDMLPIAEKLDNVGFWSLETWGGATFDACIRFLGEDPWERIRTLKAAMPNTPMQMLFRGQNILGYRHYADDVVDKFVERAAVNGVDVFRIFDAMNDLRNLETAIKATLKVEKHAQGTMSYTVSPVHNMEYWVDMGKRLEEMGCDSICIKDMAGLLNPYVGHELVTRLKEAISIPIAMQSHATTGMSTATNIKCAEAGIDMLDTSISSMSMTYGHSATESVVAILKESDRDTGLDLNLLQEIAAYFRAVRKKYAKFEGSLKGVDSRILVAQVPGGMLTNMENQLREQGASDKLDQVLEEIPRVRKDLGYIPLVTPTSQIVGTQAVINVLMGERYKSIAKETEGVLKGEYGATPAPVNSELQMRVLDGAEPITCRPADRLDDEMDKLTAEYHGLVEEHGIKVAADEVDDVLIYALFPQVGLKFLKNRDNPAAFEPPPGAEPPAPAQTPAPAAATADKGGPESYQVEVNGVAYNVKVTPSGAVSEVAPAPVPAATQSAEAAVPGAAQGEAIDAPLSGNIHSIKVAVGDKIGPGDVVMVLEAMKMETEVRATTAGTVAQILVKEGDSVQVGSPLLSLS